MWGGRELSKLVGLLGNRNFILVLAVFLGLGLGQGSRWTVGLVVPALALVMMLSMMGVEGRLFRSPRAWVSPVLVGLAVNYVVLGGLTLVLSSLFVKEEAFRTGFVFLSVVPPAVGVIPFTGFLGGDIEFSILATLGYYLSALFVIPLMLYVLLGFGGSLQVKLLVTMAQVIIVPLILSRVLVRSGVAERIARVRGLIMNWCFFLVVYTMVGLNRQVFFSQSLSLVPVAVLAVVNSFLLWTVI